MDHELQNEINRTRTLLKMRYLMKIIKSKGSFERHMQRLEKIQRMRSMMR